MPYVFSRFTIIMLIGTLAALIGCAKSPPSRFYLLSGLPETQTAGTAGQAKGAIAIGIGPVQFPGYLDRPQIVTRTSTNELDLAELDRWAEPLQENFTRVVADNLSLLLSTDQVAIYPWDRATPVDYQVTIEVTRLDNEPGGDVVLDARWSILRDEGTQLLLTRRSRYVEPAGAGDYGARVAAKSRAVGALSQAIAKAIQDLPARRARR